MTTQITLVGPLDEAVFDFKYATSWYPEANGGGRSLVLVDRTKASTKDGWRPSAIDLGTPGTDESAAGLRLPGDSTADGVTDISDIIDLLYSTIGEPIELQCADGAPWWKACVDWNGDGLVDLSDAIWGLQYLFLSGPPHALGTQCVPAVGCTAACR